MEREADRQKKRAEAARILDAAARFYQWWKDGEAKLKARQEKKAA